MLPTGLVLAFCLLCWALAERDRDRTLEQLRSDVSAMRQSLTPPTPRRLTLAEAQQAINRGEAAGLSMTHLRVAYAQELLDAARAEGRMPPLSAAALALQGRPTPRVP